MATGASSTRRRCASANSSALVWLLVIAVIAALTSSSSAGPSSRRSTSRRPKASQSHASISALQWPSSWTHSISRRLNGPIIEPNSSVIDTWPSLAG